MRRPVGVILAAVVLGLMALMGIFGGLISVATSIFIQNSPAIPSVPGMRGIMIVTALLMLCFFLFCGWTVVGLVRMRTWARYSIVVIGGLEFLFCALLSGLMILMRNTPLPVPAGTAAPVNFQSVFLGLGAIYGFLSLIGAWWLVYFNLAPVREAFVAAGQPTAAQAAASAPQVIVTQPAAMTAQAPAGTPGWRIVIIAWSCLMLISVLYVPLLFFMHLPLFFFGVVFRGTAATALMLVLFGAQFYLGVGLLRKWKAAWYLGLVWQVYTVVYFLTLLLPGVFARFVGYQQEIQGQWLNLMKVPSPGATPDMRPFLMMGMVVGGIGAVAIVALFTTALVKRREDYLHA